MDVVENSIGDLVLYVVVLPVRVMLKKKNEVNYFQKILLMILESK